jgi:hypothetical protein
MLQRRCHAHRFRTPVPPHSQQHQSRHRQAIYPLRSPCLTTTFSLPSSAARAYAPYASHPCPSYHLHHPPQSMTPGLSNTRGNGKRAEKREVYRGHNRIKDKNRRASTGWRRDWTRRRTCFGALGSALMTRCARCPCSLLYGMTPRQCASSNSISSCETGARASLFVRVY